jgi:hypothetical protein
MTVNSILCYTVSATDPLFLGFQDSLDEWIKDDEEEFNEQLPLLMYGMFHGMQHYSKTKRLRSEESGLDFVNRMLADPHYYHTMFRMNPELFEQLYAILVGSYGLKSSTRSTSREALGMFLWMVGTPQPVRQAMTIFGRSLDTIHRNFAKVLDALVKLAAEIIKPRDPEFSTIHPRLQQTRFKGLFNNCIGAIDGTRIDVVVPTHNMVQYLNRKGRTSQNVMAVCDFDMRFTFVLAGWPGSVHDMRVFNDAMTKYGDKFPHPPQGKHVAQMYPRFILKYSTFSFMTWMEK